MKRSDIVFVSDSEEAGEWVGSREWKSKRYKTIWLDGWSRQQKRSTAHRRRTDKKGGGRGQGVIRWWKYECSFKRIKSFVKVDLMFLGIWDPISGNVLRVLMKFLKTATWTSEIFAWVFQESQYKRRQCGQNMKPLNTCGGHASKRDHTQISFLPRTWSRKHNEEVMLVAGHRYKTQTERK